MFIYTTITNEDSSIELVAYLEKKGYTNAMLIFKHHDEMEHSWDNDSYLKDVVLPYLRGESNPDVIPGGQSEIDELNKVFDENREEVYELFLKGQEMGFFDNVDPYTG